jgi:hypothetical protein
LFQAISTKPKIKKEARKSDAKAQFRLRHGGGGTSEQIIGMTLARGPPPLLRATFNRPQR